MLFSSRSVTLYVPILPVCHISSINFFRAAQSDHCISLFGSDSKCISFGHTDVTCKTKAQADLILLVDGSWSIGRLNFKTIRAFIARMVGVFDIGPDRVQIGKVLTYSITRFTECQLWWTVYT